LDVAYWHLLASLVCSIGISCLFYWHLLSILLTSLVYSIGISCLFYWHLLSVLLASLVYSVTIERGREKVRTTNKHIGRKTADRKDETVSRNINSMQLSASIHTERKKKCACALSFPLSYTHTHTHRNTHTQARTNKQTHKLAPLYTERR